MEPNRLENSLFSILKRVMLIVIGSGLITNALYIYGLAFYEGYIERSGFDFYLFPIDWDDAIFWTYHASREVGFNSISKLENFSTTAILVTLGSVYFIVRLWIQLSDTTARNKHSTTHSKVNFAAARKVYKFRLKHKWKYILICKPLRWLFITEQSVIAFFASYFFLVCLFFIPVFVFIWSYFPIIGLNHGERVATERLSYYENNLCGNKNDYWNKCIEIETLHLSSSDLPERLYGNLIVKEGDLVGVLTKEGPVTLTIPKNFYYRTKENSRN